MFGFLFGGVPVDFFQCQKNVTENVTCLVWQTTGRFSTRKNLFCGEKL